MTESNIQECFLHKDALLFFCNSCFHECCYKCLCNDHYGHNVILNNRLTPRLEKACSSANETLASAKSFEDKLKQENVEFIFKTRSIIKKIHADAQRYILLVNKQIDNMKEEIEEIIMSNKSRFDEYKQSVAKIEEIKIASSDTLLACLNKESTKNPGQIVELLENLNLMETKFSFLSKKPAATWIKSLGFSFPSIKYNSYESIPSLGKIEWNQDENECDSQIHDSPDNSLVDRHGSSKRACIISGIENRFGHKIFILSGELNDVSSDVTIDFTNDSIDAKEKEVKNGLQQRFKCDPKSHDLNTTNGDALDTKIIVPCILNTEAIDKMAGRESIKKAVVQALTKSESSAGKSRLAISTSLDDLSYGVVGTIINSIFDHLTPKDAGSVTTVNIIGKKDMVLGILYSTIDLFLEDSLKPERSLKTMFASGFQLEMCLGSLVESECDAILLAVHPSLDLTVGNLSKQVLDAAGRKIQEECYARMPAKVYPGNIVVTKGYNLKCKYVCHGYLGARNGNVDAESVKNILVNAIRTSFEFGLSSLAVPALGTGIGLEECVSAALILEEVYRFAMLHSFDTTLQRIVIVLHPSDEHLIKAFFGHMRALNPQLRIPMWTSIIKANSDTRTPGKPESKPAKKDEPLNERYNSVTENLVKQLTLTADSGRHKSSSSNGAGVSKFGYVWRYRENDGNWVDYPEKINVMLESNYTKGKEKTIWIENGATYSVSYLTMTEKMVGSDNVASVKRVESSK